jgi:phosphatidate cytidylyltransferase
MSEADQAIIRQRPTKADDKPLETMTTSTGIASYINSMDQKWRNWWIRGFFTFIMVGLFGVFIYIGPLALAVLVRAIREE